MLNQDVRYFNDLTGHDGTISRRLKLCPEKWEVQPMKWRDQVPPADPGVASTTKTVGIILQDK